MLTHAGQTRSVHEWAKLTGIPVSTIKCRIDRLGWPAERALTIVVDARRAEVGRFVADKVRKPPAVKRHKASGRAYVRLKGGKFKYLGAWGSEAAAAAYKRFLARWAVESEQEAPRIVAGDRLKIIGLTVAYMKWVGEEFRKFGRPTSEPSCRRIACRVVNALYADVDADAFTPKMLEACQQRMIEQGYARTSINLHTWRIRDMWRWGVKEGLVELATWQKLATVGPVRYGRGAVEPKRVRPVPEADFLATVATLEEPYATIARLHRLMGCRSGELCALRAGDIDRGSGSEWRYEVRPEINKQAARERDQVYWLGPRCQDLLAPFLLGRGDEEHLFVPTGRNGRPPLPHVTVGLYRGKIARACKLAGVPHWHPHRLRHSKATEVRAGYGAEAVKAVIGDTTDKMADRYAERNEDLARRVARETA